MLLQPLTIYLYCELRTGKNTLAPPAQQRRDLPLRNRPHNGSNERRNTKTLHEGGKKKQKIDDQSENSLNRVPRSLWSVCHKVHSRTRDNQEGNVRFLVSPGARTL